MFTISEDSVYTHARNVNRFHSSRGLHSQYYIHYTHPHTVFVSDQRSRKWQKQICVIQWAWSSAVIHIRGNKDKMRMKILKWRERWNEERVQDSRKAPPLFSLCPSQDSSSIFLHSFFPPFIFILFPNPAEILLLKLPQNFTFCVYSNLCYC